MARRTKTLFYNIRVSQGSVATRLRCDRIFSFIANCPQTVPVKELQKSVNTWQRCGQKFGGMFFMVHGVLS